MALLDLPKNDMLPYLKAEKSDYSITFIMIEGRRKCHMLQLLKEK